MGGREEFIGVDFWFFSGVFLDRTGKRLRTFGQRLNVCGDRIAFLGQGFGLLDLQFDQGNDEGLHGRRHLGFDIGQYLDSGWLAWHGTIGAENRDRNPNRYFKPSSRPINR